ncbi:MAG: hypothetical protein KC435_00470 [Thermomicrobiales bacterium]|nr:hypothetical protein [Thermomicrobiales bacterium]
MKPYLLFPIDVIAQGALPTNLESMSSDLELDVLFNAMAAGDRFFYTTVRQIVLAAPPEPDVIRYRQHILQDCLQLPELFRDIYRVAVEALEVQRQHYFGFMRSNPGAALTGSIHLLAAYVPLLRQIHQIMAKSASEIRSEGLKRFLAATQSELSEDYLNEIMTHVHDLELRRGATMQATIGQVGKPMHYRLLAPKPAGWRDLVPVALSRDAYSFEIAPRDDAGFQALDNMHNRGVVDVANAVAHAADHIRAFFNALRTECAFYLACLHLHHELATRELPVCFPDMYSSDQLVFSATGLYDVSLALQMDPTSRVVGNDIAADSKSLIMITGANQGGKSTFLRGTGLAQLMAQCGMFVPASSLRANIVTGLFTHYKREEDTSMNVGKFEEEVRRMSEIADQITPGNMLLCNESFASTNEREGSEIGRQVVQAMTEAGVKVVYVTHLYDLAHGFEMQGSDNVLLLRAERGDDGTHTFKLTENPPLATSFGRDLYARIFGA